MKSLFLFVALSCAVLVRLYAQSPAEPDTVEITDIQGVGDCYGRIDRSIDCLQRICREYGSIYQPDANCFALLDSTLIQVASDTCCSIGNDTLKNRTAVFIYEKGGGRCTHFEHKVYIIHSQKIVLYKIISTIYVNPEGLTHPLVKSNFYVNSIPKIPTDYKLEMVYENKVEIDYEDECW